MPKNHRKARNQWLSCAVASVVSLAGAPTPADAEISQPFLTQAPAPQAQISAPALPAPQAQSSYVDSGVAWQDPFYLPPEEIPAPGTLIRTQPAPQLLNMLGPDFPGYAEKILYSSTAIHGDPVAVSGFIIEPANPWQGNGPQPTVVFAPGTRGAGDACAPSKGPGMYGQYDPVNQALGTNYEMGFYQAASLLGMRVVVTDYIGLGTPGQHTYVLHTEEGHAVLDAARATTQTGHPVGFYGYSQGGGAVAAAAEQHATYAPGINLVGTYSGAAPADMIEVMNGVDNSMIVSVLGFAYHGWGERFPFFSEIFDAIANDRGKQFIASTKDACIVDSVLQWAMTDTSTLTTTGESFTQAAFRDPRVIELLESQKLGQRPLATPIMVATGGNDDLVPSPQTTQMARDYCAQGATVTYLDEGVPALTPGTKLGLNHVGGMFTQALPAASWLRDRFNGVPAPNHCGAF
ncbi:lipase family protein [Corynebacterium cystitidis]|uniref:lipase family protein n=1 Tax=Corynebacterium cystitidis TaxID=35757 RepID=UPI00211E66C9|nr:lipase family protein [Corynebacterium cystitidis]